MAVDLVVRGPFSLDESVAFAERFEPAAIGGGEGVFRAALVDDDGTPVGLAVRQAGSRLTVVHESALPDKRVADHAARILSVDVDGAGLAEVGSRDPVVAALVERFPGRRPVCFGSPYEAAAWAVLSQRTSMRQAAAVKRQLSDDLGEAVAADGRHLTAFPAPAVLAEAADLPGVSGRRAERLRAVAQATLQGLLDPGSLRALEADEALQQLQEVPGIGPFSAALVLGRGAGHPDLAPPSIAPARRAVAEAYGLESVDDAGAAEIAEGWRPFRTWVLFLLRNAASAAPAGPAR